MLSTIILLICVPLTLGVPTCTAPLITHEKPVPDHYMVSFFGNHTMEQHELTINRKIRHLVRDHWDEAPFGYTGRFDSELVDSIRADPSVEFVEQDYYISLVDFESNGPWNETLFNRTLPGRQNPTLPKRTTQQSVPYNLEVISANGKREAGTGYQYSTHAPAAGQNVDIYIVDSSVNVDHSEFGGRARTLVDATETVYYDEQSPAGHGTEVAGIAAGRKYGVAKRANILSCKIVHGPNGQGTGRNAVTAIRRIMRNHNQRKDQAGFRGSVVNYSVNISPPGDGSLRKVISAADAADIIQVAAAGNGNNEAINQIPAAFTEVVTVASMTESYEMAGSSAYGTSVDIIAPGAGITAASANSNTGYHTYSGTSFAAPHVAGVIAEFMSYASGPQTKADVYNMLIDFSIKNVVRIPTRKDRTPNRVVNNGARTRSWPPSDELKI